MVYGSSKERKSGSQPTSEERAGGDCTVGVPLVAVNQVVETSYEDDENARADRDSGEELRNP